MPRPIINFYAPPESAAPRSPTVITPQDTNYLYVSYEHLSDGVAALRGNYYLYPYPTCTPSKRNFSPSPIQSRRRGAVDYGPSTRSPLSPINLYSNPVVRSRVLPQRLLNPPRSENMVRSIWFKSKHAHEYDGVAMVDTLRDRVEDYLVGARDEVFDDFVVSNNEVKFNILWPGYGHVSWVANIPILLYNEKGKPCGKITRAQLASAVAQHFRAFMTYHSTLRTALPDPSWRIGDDDEGIRFEQLRLMRLFCCCGEHGKNNVTIDRKHRDGDGNSDGSGCWQAEVLVVGV